MTRCSKTVTEVEFKFFLTREEAVANSNYFIETVDVEGGSPPDHIQSKTLQEDFLLRVFPRQIDGVSFLEKAYLKIN